MPATQELAVVRKVRVEKRGLAITVDLLLGSTTVTVPWVEMGRIIGSVGSGTFEFESLVGRPVVVEASKDGHHSFVELR